MRQDVEFSSQKSIVRLFDALVYHASYFDPFENRLWKRSAAEHDDVSRIGAFDALSADM